MSDTLRITGMYSGIDTDSMVKQLIQIEQVKVDKAEQEKTWLEWQQEDYRDVANSLRVFQEEYFDLLNPSTNMRSASTFNMFTATSSSTAISLQTSSSSFPGSFSIESVTQLATQDTLESASEVLGKITSTDIATIDTINTQLAADNTISFTLDGKTAVISLEEGTYVDHDAFITDLNSKLQDAFTNVDVFAKKNGADPYQIEFGVYPSGTLEADVIAGTAAEETGHTLEVEGTNETLLGHLGLTAGQSNTVNMSGTLSEVFGITEASTVVINDVSFTFDETDTIQDMMNEINSSEAKVTVTFDSFSDTFKMTSSEYGTDGAISLTDDATTTLFSDMNLVGDVTHTAAQNAVFTINGETSTRSNNTFEISGTTVTLNETFASEVTIDVVSDTTDVKELITGFVEKYNEMISSINTKFSEVRDYDFPPLTDEQKEGLSDDEIEDWELQARLGTLNGDTTLSRITNKMRQALYEQVDGLGISLYDIGIQSSANYSEQGKLVINETKLDKALSERPNEVIELFTKESDTAYTDFDNRTTRYGENGLSARIYDILQDNIRITRDNDGRKGYLIEKAGSSSGVDVTSELAKKILDYDDVIDRLLDALADKENTYYAQFTSLETALAEMESQSAWLASQFGG